MIISLVLKREDEKWENLLRIAPSPEPEKETYPKIQNDSILCFTGSWVAAGRDRDIAASIGKHPTYNAIIKLHVTGSDISLSYVPNNSFNRM